MPWWHTLTKRSPGHTTPSEEEYVVSVCVVSKLQSGGAMPV